MKLKVGSLLPLTVEENVALGKAPSAPEDLQRTPENDVKRSSPTPPLQLRPPKIPTRIYDRKASMPICDSKPLPVDIDRFQIRRYNSVPNEDDDGSPKQKTDVNSLVKRGRLWAQRHQRRLVHKSGETNLTFTNVSQRRRRFILDLFTTLLDLKWSYTLLLCVFIFIMSFLLFAVGWYLICWWNEDTSRLFEDESDLDHACVQYVNDFASSFLFSLETQHTIGYGRRVINTRCKIAIFLLCCQTCFGLLIQSLLTGLIFAKLSRPRRRGETIMFSKNAVICIRDGEYCLVFRVGDMRHSQLVAVTVRAIIVKNKMTREGETLPLYQQTIKVHNEKSDDNEVFLAWPSTVVHKINSESPLYDVSADSLFSESFELIVILEGTIESSGMVTQVRTSYLPCEILWAHRLSPLITYQKDNGKYKIDYSSFHETTPVLNMPDCSARELAAKPPSRSPVSGTDHDWGTLSVRRRSPISSSRVALGFATRKASLSGMKRMFSLNKFRRGSLKQDRQKKRSDRSKQLDSDTNST